MEALREIQIASLASVQARYDGPAWGGDPATSAASRLAEYDALLDGRAVLVLPDGKRYWVPVSAGEERANLPGPVGEALLSAVLDHNAIAAHNACEVFFEQATNALTSAFCIECGRFVDLTEDVRKMDAQVSPDA